MTCVIKTEATIRKASKQRPKSLLLSIPPVAREAMELKADTKIFVEVHYDTTGKYLKIYKKD